MSKFNFNELLEHTKDKRQLRLFAVACCRNIWNLLTDPRSRNAIEIAEQFVDSLVTEEELDVARIAALAAASDAMDAGSVAWGAANGAAWAAANGGTWAAAWYAAWYAARAAENGAWYAERYAEKEQQFVFLQDITNQPSVELNPSLHSWNNSLLPKFATNIYTNRDFSLMPILADALEEANAPDIFIEHCREEVHVKGCWLLDVLMGKREKLTRQSNVKT